MPNCLNCEEEIKKNPNQTWFLHEKRKYCSRQCCAKSRIGTKFTIEQKLKMSKSAKNRKSRCFSKEI